MGFRQTLAEHGLELFRNQTETLQVNVGLLCNFHCQHCHLEAGPGRPEVMGAETAGQVIDYARRGGFGVIDLTGGAPELNPNIELLLSGLADSAPRIILRSNLVALGEEHERIISLARELKVVLVASLPSLNQAQAESQCGQGNFPKALAVLKRLNSLGYGRPESGLELNLVSNPTGAFLPTSQVQAEKRYREVLWRKWEIEFNQLHCFANVPLGRYRTWLKHSGNLDSYLGKLQSGFNPFAVSSVMCRNLVSVDWQGYLYDCDFNLARGLHLGGHRMHVSEMEGRPEPGMPIAVGDHCYACTAGSGFT